MSLIIILTLTAAVMFIISSRQFRRNALNNVLYKVRTDVHEVYEGQDFFVYESIANIKNTPLPNVRMDVSLPRGLDFCLYKETEDGDYVTTEMHTVESVFVLKPQSAVERRWRVMAKKRGVYQLGEGRMVVCDIFGVNKLSAFYDPDTSPESRITVLPSPIELDRHFSPVHEPMGNISNLITGFSDPLLYAGTREYRQGDSQSRINWKASARMHSPMVNLNEYTEKNRFDIILNLQSRPREDTGTVPEGEDMVELGVSVAAAVFDLGCTEDIPMRLISNTESNTLGRDYFVSDYYSGRSDCREAMRMLARLQLKLSCRVDDMLEDILREAVEKGDKKAVIIITSYIDDAIISFARKMKDNDIDAIIYATSSFRSVISLPRDIPIYHKTYK